MSDRPSSEIQPALTAEEWRTLKLWHAGKMIGGKVRGMVVGDLPESHQHGAAAFALYGKPYGFTHEDVAMLLSGEPPDTAFSDEHMEYASWRDSLARRLAALLPPKP